MIEPEKVRRVHELLVAGSEVRQMMTVVGEEGASTEDFLLAMKAEFFDNAYLQQNAFDEVDAATPAKRQQFAFDKILEVLEMELGLEDKEEIRRAMVRATDDFRNRNYAAPDSDEYTRWLSEIDAFIAAGGRTP